MPTIRSIRFLLIAFVVLAAVSASAAQLIVSIGIAPPPLPVYEQPLIPGPGYIWTPGYWAYGPDGYFWLTGTWVLPPSVGLLWTPGFWAWDGGLYHWHRGYWGPHVGYYGGINYGFGYHGIGYDGGYWRDRHFFYNTHYNHIGRMPYTYSRPVVINNVTHVSYNGGHGGIEHHMTPDEQRWSRERHVNATPVQSRHERAALGNREMRHSENHGNPRVGGVTRPGAVARPVSARPAGPATRTAGPRTAGPRPTRTGPDARPAGPRTGTANRTPGARPAPRAMQQGRAQPAPRSAPQRTAPHAAPHAQPAPHSAPLHNTERGPQGHGGRPGR